MTSASFNPTSTGSTPTAVLNQISPTLLAQRLAFVESQAEEIRQMKRGAQSPWARTYHTLRNELARITAVMQARGIRRCRGCDGKGTVRKLDRTESITCEECGGDGKYETGTWTEHGLDNEIVSCHRCGGTGQSAKNYYKQVTCDQCGGTGEVK